MSNNVLKVGITGNMGSGKSIVSSIFRILNVPVYDADTRAKWVMSHDKILLEQIVSEFGEDSYLTDGQLNRQFLAAKVFNDQDRLEKLNSIVHPRVGIDFENWIRNNSESAYIIKEAALLFESGSAKQLDKIIVVTAPEPVRLKRVQKRDPQRSVQQIKDIFNMQMDEGDKAKLADYIIKNDESELVVDQVLDLHNNFSQTDN